MNEYMDILKWLITQPFEKDDYSTGFEPPGKITIWFESEELGTLLLLNWKDRLISSSRRD